MKLYTLTVVSAVINTTVHSSEAELMDFARNCYVPKRIQEGTDPLAFMRKTGKRVQVNEHVIKFEN